MQHQSFADVFYLKKKKKVRDFGIEVNQPKVSVL